MSIDDSSTIDQTLDDSGYLFMRIVPILRDIGLWGPKVRKAPRRWPPNRIWPLVVA
ncbi:MAG: hypothetical protein M3137_14790 [Actinomycetota bacterium]|nr:hypothetical protein [Actinomycetota bacterium]